ncbi:MAG: putative lipid II flippase FtsW [Chloroflexi bacterium]|nr:putative lipid II flippase FtsW [Chloroflexota bacterium]
MKLLARLPRTTSFDLSLLAVVLALLAIGLAMVFSASGMRALDTLDEPRYYLVQQALWAAIGLVAMTVAARTDYHRYRAIALPLLVVTGALLVAVLIPGLGTRVGGAARWIRVSSFAGVQPAEIAKLALIVYFAFWLAHRRARASSLAVVGPFLGIVVAGAALIIAEPDLGTAIVIVTVGLAMYFVAGARPWIFAALLALAATAVATVALTQPYRLRRVMTFLDPWSDPRGDGFQTIQALYGLALGGPFGEGLGAGREKFGYLPAAYTDSIFAVLGNELGLVGTLSVIGLFLVLAFKGVRIALRAPDPSGALLASGITVWLAFQAWLNMAVVASLVPLTGITLPFISYGGSSLCVGLVAVGILLNVGQQGGGHATADPRARRTAKPPGVPRAARGRRDRGAREPAAGDRRGGGRDRSRDKLPLPWWSSRTRG